MKVYLGFKTFFDNKHSVIINELCASHLSASLIIECGNVFFEKIYESLW